MFVERVCVHNCTLLEKKRRQHRPGWKWLLGEDVIGIGEIRVLGNCCLTLAAGVLGSCDSFKAVIGNVNAAFGEEGVDR